MFFFCGTLAFYHRLNGRYVIINYVIDLLQLELLNFDLYFTVVIVIAYCYDVAFWSIFFSSSSSSLSYCVTIILFILASLLLCFVHF